MFDFVKWCHEADELANWRNAHIVETLGQVPRRTRAKICKEAASCWERGIDVNIADLIECSSFANL